MSPPIIPSVSQGTSRSGLLRTHWEVGTHQMWTEEFSTRQKSAWLIMNYFCPPLYLFPTLFQASFLDCLGQCSKLDQSVNHCIALNAALAIDMDKEVRRLNWDSRDGFSLIRHPRSMQRRAGRPKLAFFTATRELDGPPAYSSSCSIPLHLLDQQ